ncbi:hypothetical protein C8J56DRAFT_937304 [Mycena floridula]|nr:hypothetical protein C8J56DRAFT_937304 [Mycena floridula]
MYGREEGQREGYAEGQYDQERQRELYRDLERDYEEQRQRTATASPLSLPSINTFSFRRRHQEPKAFASSSSLDDYPCSTDSNRWSDVIPPETALTFAVIWDPEDELVVFSGAELSDSSRDMDCKSVDSPSEAYDNRSQILDNRSQVLDNHSQVLTVAASELPYSENTATLAYFHDNLELLFPQTHDSRLFPETQDLQFRESSSSMNPDPYPTRTQTSSTMDGLDVYIRGSLMWNHSRSRASGDLTSQSHKPENLNSQITQPLWSANRTQYSCKRYSHRTPNRYNSCLEDLDRDFEFDPSTEFARLWIQRELQEELREKEIQCQKLAEHEGSFFDEGFFEHLPSDTESGAWSTMEFDDWSTVELPQILPRVQTRRLRKRRPTEISRRPREISAIIPESSPRALANPSVPSSTTSSPAKSNASPTRKCSVPNIPKLVRAISSPEFVHGLRTSQFIRGFGKRTRSDDLWVCVEITQDTTQRFV